MNKPLLSPENVATAATTARPFAVSKTSASSLTTDQGQSQSTASLPHLLIVDDDRPIRIACETIAQSVGFETSTTETGEQALRKLEADPYDALLLDIRMPGLDGLNVLESVSLRHPELVVIIMTGYGSITSAVSAMKKGAYDYITKPFHVEELRTLLRRVSRHLKQDVDSRHLRHQLHSEGGFSGMVGRTPEMQRLFRVSARAAQSTHPVLIHGELGTGREMLARALHQNSANRNQPFLCLDCGTVPTEELDLELFGSVKGNAHSGSGPREGLLEAAQGGTVLLKQIESLPLETQNRLLRALQEHEFLPAGAGKPVPMRARVLAASCANLEQVVASGQFRQDLYYRLGVVSMNIPPLRERRDDIPVLARHFLSEAFERTGQHHALAETVVDRLMDYEWPGNVAELQACLTHACTVAAGPQIRMYDLPFTLSRWQPPVEMKREEHIPTLAEVERDCILNTIERMHGDKLKAARALGIGRTTLYRKLMEYEQHVPKSRKENPARTGTESTRRP